MPFYQFPQYRFLSSLALLQMKEFLVNFHKKRGEKMKSPYTQIGVDIKITDFCPFGCSFCYQGSTEKGGHADFESLKKAIDFFVDDVGIFEVILGGGEPTLYPHFEDLLLYLLQEKKVNVGVTTRNKKIFSILYKLSKKMKFERGKFYPGVFVGLSVGGDIRNTANSFIGSLISFLESTYRKEKGLQKKKADKNNKFGSIISFVQDLFFYEEIAETLKNVLYGYRFHLVGGVDFYDFNSLKIALKELFLGILEAYNSTENKWINIENIEVLLLGYKDSKLDISFTPRKVDYSSLGKNLEKTDFTLYAVASRGFGETKISTNSSSILVVGKRELNSKLEEIKNSGRIKEVTTFSLSVDFPFMKNILPYISKNKYEKSLIEKEGKHTFYYDAVKGILSESSYSFNCATKFQDYEKDFQEFSLKIRHS